METPPGQEDPYISNREQEEVNEKELESVPEQEVGVPEDGNEYIRATTADDLDEVGGLGWGDVDLEAENPYKGFGPLCYSIATWTNFSCLASCNTRGQMIEVVSFLQFIAPWWRSTP